jgi:hypothetical protein
MTLIISKGLTLAKAFTQQPYMWEFPAQYGLWSPAEISTALWLDAADASTVTTESGAVSQWNDKSGNSRNATQAAAGGRPALTVNGLNSKNIITFDGGTDVLSLSDLTLGRNAGALCYFFAASTANVAITSFAPLFDLNNSTGPDRASVYIRSSVIEAGGRRLDADSFQSHTNGTPSNNTAYLGSVLYNYSSAALSIGFNGSALTSRGGGFQTAGNTSDTSSNAIRIGASTDTGGGGSFYNGYIAEFIATRTVPSAGDRQRIEGYLAHKWGLTANLPSDHPYKTVGPTP